MKHIFTTLCFALCCHNVQAQDVPGSHVDMTTTILDFLSRTELCLNSCTDAASTHAAIPQLLQLKQECDKLVEAQKALPEPTVQDYMAVQTHMDAFNTIWKAIRNHIARLQQEKLLTQEIIQILHIAPEDAP